MRICLLIPDGVGIRNYLYSDIIKIFHKKGHEVILWHSLDEKLIKLTEDRLGINLRQYQFEHKPDSAGAQLLREASRYARLQLNAAKKDNPTILDNWSKTSPRRLGRWRIRLSELLGGRLKSYQAVASAETLGFKIVKKSKAFQNAVQMLQEIKPDLLFCTHQRVFSVTASIEAAKSLGIKTSTAIFSWDNLPKGRLPFRVDQYLVWSDYMKSEMNAYYPEISNDSIQVTGTPQFDFYLKKGVLMDRTAFAEKYGLDISKTWVCFSGCDTLTSPNDPHYLKDVAQALKNESDLQLIMRPVPVESSQRFEHVFEEFPSIKVIEPLWVKGSHWGNFFPLYEDIELLVNLTYHCKVVINMGSTMALDFAAFDNVGLYLRYDHPVENQSSSVKTIYRFEHFRSMGDWKAVGYIFSPEDILPLTRRAIEKPDEIAPDRKLWFERIVDQSPEKFASERVTEALLSLLEENT